MSLMDEDPTPAALSPKTATEAPSQKEDPLKENLQSEDPVKWWHSDDSDSSDEDPTAAPKEDPLFDPNMDDEDSVWVDKQRQGRVSDAILSCPSCFTTVSIDCQQHMRYEGQYRALFVMNCRVDESQVMQAKAPGQQGGSKKKKKGPKGAKPPPEGVSTSEAEIPAAPGSTPATDSCTVERYHPVCCDVCDTEVGVRDEQQMYHFFHVFPSNA
eukprot:gene24596-10215_t